MATGSRRILARVPSSIIAAPSRAAESEVFY